MIEIKFVGSGGQGSVVAGKLLADAGARAGYHCQSFAAYGALRRGGHVESYVRFSKEPIHLHSKMYSPDYLILMDEAFSKDPHIADGLKPEGTILINASKPVFQHPAFQDRHIYAMDARKIALEADLALPSGLPVINTAVLGGVVALIPDVGVEHVIEALDAGKIPYLERNAAAVKKAFEKMNNVLEGKTETTASETANGPGTEPLYPVIDERCNLCELCYIFCPDIAIHFDSEAQGFKINEKACKACGICVRVCPRAAISWRGGTA